MKKNVVLILSLLVMFSLPACSSGIDEVSKITAIPSAQSSSATPISSSLNSRLKESSNSSNEIRADQKFNLTYTDLISHINEEFAARGYSKVSENGDAKEEMIEGIGTVNYYQYIADNGFNITLGVDPSDEKLIQIMYSFKKKKASVDSAKKYEYCIGITEAGMAGNEAEDIDKELNLDNTKDKAVTTAISEKCMFMYSVDENGMLFMVMPND